MKHKQTVVPNAVTDCATELTLIDSCDAWTTEVLDSRLILVATTGVLVVLTELTRRSLVELDCILGALLGDNLESKVIEKRVQKQLLHKHLFEAVPRVATKQSA